MVAKEKDSLMLKFKEMACHCGKLEQMRIKHENQTKILEASHIYMQNSIHSQNVCLTNGRS